MAARIPVSGAINLREPVNRNHPLARGLVAWYLVLPNDGRAGWTWFDLCKNNDLTLTAGPTFEGPRGRQGGWGSVQFTTASSQFGVLLSAPVVPYPFSMGCLFRVGNITAIQGLMGIGRSASTSNDFHALHAAGTIGGDPIRYAAREAAGTIRNADTSVGYTANNWHSAFAVGDSATSRRVYLDGGSEGTNTVSCTPGSLTRFRVGHCIWPTPDFLNGRLDSPCVYNRALTADEVREWTLLSRRGFPGLLNRLKHRLIYSIPAAAPGGDAVPQVWSQYRRRHAG